MKLNKFDSVKASGEKKYRAKMVKSGKSWMIRGLLFSTLLFGGMIVGDKVQASTWTANSPESIIQRIKPEDKQITMIEGDTVYNIGVAINLKDPMSLLFDNGYALGEQYTLPVGTIISWDGDEVTIKNPSGETIGQGVVEPEDKYDSSKAVGVPAQVPAASQKDPDKAQNISEGIKGSETQSKPSADGQTDESGNPVKPIAPDVEQPSEPEKPTDPEQPIEPELPVEESDQLIVLKNKLTDLEASLEKAQAALTETQNTFQEANEQNSLIDQNITAAQTNYANALANEQAAQNKLANAKTALEQAIINHEAANQALIIAQTNYDNALDTSEGITSEIEAALIEAENNVINAEADVALKEAAIAPLEQAVIDASKEIAHAIEKLDEAKQAEKVDTSQLEQEIEVLQTEVNELENEIDAIKQKIADLEAAEQAKLLKQAKEAALNELAKLADLTSEEIAHYTNAINDASSIENVKDIFNQADEQNTANKEANEQAAELQKAKDEALIELAKLTDLTKVEMDEYTATISSAEDIQTIMSTLESAKAQNEANKHASSQEKELKEAKDEAIKQLDTLNLTNDEKQSFADKINGAKSQDEINTIISAAKAVSDENDQTASEQQLADTKAEAKAKIDGMDLTNEEKAAFSSQIDGAKTISEVNSIIEEAQTVVDAKEAAAKELAEAKQKAVKQLDALNLTNDEKQSFADKIKGAKSQDEINTIISAAKAVSDENDQTASEQQLADVKTEAKAKINLMVLTVEEKTAFATEIDGAKTIGEVNSIVEDAQKVSAANEAAAKELVVAKTEAITLLKSMNLSSKEFADFESQIIAATSVEKVNKIVANAQSTSDANNETQALQKAKESAIKEIQALKLKDKQSFINRINSATSIDAIQPIVNEAKEAAKKEQEAEKEAELNEAKRNALSDLERLNLQDQQEHFITRINNATSVDAINQILNEAKELSDKNNAPKEKGTVTFVIFDQKHKKLGEITLEFEGDSYSITLDDLGYGHCKYTGGSLSGKVIANENRKVSIRVEVPTVHSSQEEFDKVSGIFFDLLNEYRQENGLYEYKHSNLLTEASQIRAEELIEDFSHTRPNGGGGTSIIYSLNEKYPDERANRSAEIIAMAYLANYTAEEAANKFLEMWQNSSGHNAIMLDDRLTNAEMMIAIDDKGYVYAVTLFYQDPRPYN